METPLNNRFVSLLSVNRARAAGVFSRNEPASPFWLTKLAGRVTFLPHGYHATLAAVDKTLLSMLLAKLGVSSAL